MTGVSYLSRNDYWVAQYRQGNLSRTLISSKDFFTSVESRISAEVKFRGFSRTLLDWKDGKIPEAVFRNGLTQNQVSYLINTYGEVNV